MMKPMQFGAVRDAVLIGSGDLMVHSAKIFGSLGVRVTAVVASRHAEEPLIDSDATLVETLRGIGITYHRIDSFNDWSELENAEWAGPDSLALCFGPAWIFSGSALARFGLGMVNVNAIPVPRYLGGAHFSWQILNGDRKGGCILQEITPAIDRGPILAETFFEIPEAARLPRDYFRSYIDHGRDFLTHAINDMVDNVPFPRRPFCEVDSQRLYFPRLLTSRHGFIDWSWSARAIERFCCAFDDPYPGASTFLGGRRVQLRDVHLDSNEGGFHPFASGLIVRRYKGQAVVAASGGLLQIGEISSESDDVSPLLREGQRFHTPSAALDDARTFRPRLSAAGFAS